jgi:hypothetical protein
MPRILSRVEVDGLLKKLATVDLTREYDKEEPDTLISHDNCSMRLFDVPAEWLIKALKRKFPDVKIIL